VTKLQRIREDDRRHKHGVGKKGKKNQLPQLSTARIHTQKAQSETFLIPKSVSTGKGGMLAKEYIKLGGVSPCTLFMSRIVEGEKQGEKKYSYCTE